MQLDLSTNPTQSFFGSLVGISRQAVGDLISRGVIDPQQSTQQMLHAYCSHLREVAAGRLANGDLDLATERALLARAHREKVDMQNAVTKRELAPVFLIEEVLSKAGSRAARILDTIPGLIRRRAPTLNADILDLIQAEVAKVRNIAAAVSLADLEKEDMFEDDAPASADACTKSKAECDTIDEGARHG